MQSSIVNPSNRQSPFVIRQLRPARFPRRPRLRPFPAGVRFATLTVVRALGPGFLLRRALRAFALLALGLGLAAQPVRRRAQAPAHALRLLLRRGLGLRLLGVRIVLAADQLDLRDLRAVPAAVADPQDAGVAAVPRGEARRD